jgi:hypothetical protein
MFQDPFASTIRSSVVPLPVSDQFYCRLLYRLTTANHIRASFFIHWFNILTDWCFVIWSILYNLKCAVSWIVGSFSDLQESRYCHSSFYLTVPLRCLWKVLHWRQRRIVLCSWYFALCYAFTSEKVHWMALKQGCYVQTILHVKVSCTSTKEELCGELVIWGFCSRELLVIQIKHEAHINEFDGEFYSWSILLKIQIQIDCVSFITKF